jgi:carbonic anhydrase
VQKIIQGVRKFQTEVLPEKRALFEKLAEGQAPTALVISCADSRVDMQLVTQSDPGELFFFRNAGNIVPPYGATLGAISATIEYAMVALDVPNIIVCGHTDCGAMKGVLKPQALEQMPTVGTWLRHSDVARMMVLDSHRDRPEDELLDALIKENVLAQIDNLRTHPSVAVRLARGELQLHAWVYDIRNGNVDAYDAEQAEFTSLHGERIPRATPVSRFPAARTDVIGGRG